MQFKYLGLVTYSTALEVQNEIALRIQGGGEGCILGFECDPVITLGLRARKEDILISNDLLKTHGFSLIRVDRGGQATVHNPGQLVIFPVLQIAPLKARDWVCRLNQVTRRWLGELGCETEWQDARPGLYSSRGKVVSLGLRFIKGVSTHGLAINVHNDLAPFSWIVPCGNEFGRADRVSTELDLETLFSGWNRVFCELTRPSISTNLCASVRL